MIFSKGVSLGCERCSPGLVDPLMWDLQFINEESDITLGRGWVSMK